MENCRTRFEWPRRSVGELALVSVLAEALCLLAALVAFLRARLSRHRSERCAPLAFPPIRVGLATFALSFLAFAFAWPVWRKPPREGIVLVGRLEDFVHSRLERVFGSHMHREVPRCLL